jgi:hypothetical protein
MNGFGPYIAEHKQQAEEQEQDEAQKGGDGTDRVADVPASHDGLHTNGMLKEINIGFAGPVPP